MGSMIALAIFMSNSSVSDVEDFIPTSKVSQYMNQVHMKSSGDEGRVDIKNKKQN